MASQGPKGCPGVPTSALPGKCSCVWTFINEALTYHRWGVDSGFSGTLGAISPGRYGGLLLPCVCRDGPWSRNQAGLG